MKKQFLTPRLTTGLNRLLDKDELNGRERHARRDQTPRGDVRTALFLLHDDITSRIMSVSATRLIEVPDLGSQQAFHITFPEDVSVSATFTVNGTALATAFNNASTTTDVQAAIDSAFGSGSGIHGAAIAGNVFVWPVNTLTTDNADVVPVEVNYRPLWESHNDEPVRDPKSGAAERGKAYYCNWVNGQGWCIAQPDEIGGFAVVRPYEICNGIGFACDCVQSTVITASCGSGVIPGETLSVWDLCRTWLNMPPELLWQANLYAQKVQIHEDAYNRPPGLTGNCRWIVVGMCCIEGDQYGY
ncbi:MAG: hypothetical protein RIK87_08405 [Fuerstiella sp.]